MTARPVPGERTFCEHCSTEVVHARVAAGPGVRRGEEVLLQLEEHPAGRYAVPTTTRDDVVAVARRLDPDETADERIEIPAADHAPLCLAHPTWPDRTEPIHPTGDAA